MKTPSLEGLPTKAKEDPSPHEMRLSTAGHQPSIPGLREIIIIIIIIIIITIIIITITYFFKDHNGNKTTQLFCVIPVIVPQVFLQYRSIFYCKFLIC